MDRLVSSFFFFFLPKNETNSSQSVDTSPRYISESNQCVLLLLLLSTCMHATLSLCFLPTRCLVCDTDTRICAVIVFSTNTIFGVTQTLEPSLLVFCCRDSNLEGGALPRALARRAGEQWCGGVQRLSLPVWGIQRVAMAQRLPRFSHR